MICILKVENVFFVWVMGKGILGSGVIVGKVCEWNCEEFYRAG